MSSVLFGYNISLTTAATPSTGFLVAYDTDGILKQKDSDGIITPIGGSSSFTGISSTPSLADVLNVSNDSETYSILMGTATSIMMGSASYITSQNGLSSLYLDYNSATSSIYLTNGYNYLSINNSNIKLIGSALSSNIEVNNGTNYLKLGTKNELFSVNEISLKIWNASDEILLKSNIGVSVSSADSISAAVFIGSQNSTFDSNVSNSVIIGGSNQYATQNDSVYIPDTYLQDTKKLRGTLGNASLGFTDTNNLILENSSSLLAIISSSSSTSLSTNGVIISDTTTTVKSPDMYSSPVFISTKNSSILQGVHNSVIIGGENLISSLTNSVVLGEYVNINNSYTLPNVDGVAGSYMVTDGFGNLTWQSGGGGGSGSSANFANTDLTFTGNRIHEIGTSNYLYISNDSTFATIGSFFYMAPDVLEIGNYDISKPLYLNFLGNTVFFKSNSKNAFSITNNPPYTEVIVNENKDSSIFFTVRSLSDNYLLCSDPINDRIGIGTSSPSTKLEVIGTVSTTGFRMTNGATNGYYLRSDASGNATWAAISGGSGGGLTGSGTINYLSKWSSIDTLTNSLIYDNGTNVGIGTNNPFSSSKLNLVNTSLNWSLYLSNSSSGTGGIYISNSSSEPTVLGIITSFTSATASNKIGYSYGISNSFALPNFNSGFYACDDNFTHNKVISGSYFKLNRSSPFEKYGSRTEISGSNSVSYGAHYQLSGTGSTNYGIYINSCSASNNFGIVVNRGTSIFNESGENYDFRIEGENDQNLFFADASTENIGVGTNTPSYKLQVIGTVSTTGFRMTNGATNGYVLSSDATGNATWTVNSGLFQYEIGQYVESEGGVIAHRWLSNTSGGTPSTGTIQNYLVLSIEDQISGGTTSIIWSNVGTTLIGASAQSTWDGLANSNAIVSQVSHASSAAALCLAYTVGSITDWYLPSLDELIKIYQNRWDIQQGLSIAPGGTQMSLSIYWSSTEWDLDNAFGLYFEFGYYNWNFFKSGARRVRAVRKFTI